LKPPQNKFQDIVDEMRRRLPAEPPRSLCELRLDPKNYQQLLEWSRVQLTPTTLRIHGWHAGAVVFNLIVEAARREAIGGRLWPIIAEKFPRETRVNLFPNDHPSQFLKDLIEEAVIELGLRSVLDADDTERWYITTHLQFGFSLPALRRHLPEWLCGFNVPQAVRRLTAGPDFSGSFDELWRALKHYRRGWVTEEVARGVVKGSPWLLTDWEDEVLSCAKSRLDLPDRDVEVNAVLSVPQQLVESPQLAWDGNGDAEFLCKVKLPFDSALSEPSYSLVAGARHLARVIRQVNNEYQVDRSHLRLPLTPPQQVVSLVDDSGQTVATQLVDLWDPAELVTLYNTDGRSVDDRDKFRISGALTALVADSLRLEPPPDHWMRTRGIYPRRLVRYSSIADTVEVVATDDSGAVVWCSRRGDARLKSLEQHLDGVTVEQYSPRGAIAIGESARVVVRGVPDDARLVFLRDANHSLQFDENCVSEPFRVEPAQACAGIPVTLGFRCNGEVRPVVVRRRAKVGLVGLVMHDGFDWRAVGPNEVLPKRRCLEQPARVFTGEPDREASVSLLEGSSIVRWVGSVASPLGELRASGAPLETRAEPFNQESMDLLCSGVVDQGVFLSSEVADGALKITLTRSIEPSPLHRVLAWRGDGLLLSMEAGRVEVDASKKIWRVRDVQLRTFAPWAIGLAYDGDWVGGCVAGNVARFLERFGRAGVDLGEQASLARWFRLPLLLSSRSGGVPPFVRHVRDNFPQVYAAFRGDLAARSLPVGIELKETAERRRTEAAVLRQCLVGWRPDPCMLDELSGLAFPGVDDPMGQLIVSASEEFPLLVGHALRHALDGRIPNGYSPSMYSQILEMQSLGNVTQFALLEQATEAMRVGRQPLDQRFIQDAIVAPTLSWLRGGSLDEMPRHNLSVASECDAFRKLLLCSIYKDAQQDLA
jgi:hypothetical protein